MPAHRTGVGKTNPAHNDVGKATLKEGSKNPESGRGLAGQCFSSYSSAQIALRPMAANVGVGGWYITIVIAYCPWYLAKPQPQPTTAALYPAHTFAKILVASQLHWRSFWYSDNHHISCLRPMAARHALPRNITFPGRAIHQC
ncbi:hypothetical protein FCULG_00001414 [Fusarium culmorum]|uniref:Uncharacterized protein n=1 Tax=Fusarium culmorum TaxID=5516 RepID=A0A2T4GPC5_FUSCU|nr:hypothetical protein FCULG_00001414 [Fusarium culmorum]